MKKLAPSFRFLLCDLDNTLYPSDTGVMLAVGRRMVRYIVERIGLPAHHAEQLKLQYYHRYGTTMRGLMLHHGIDPEDYLAFVHNVPLEQYIQPNPNLEAMLHSIPLRKVIFTNADSTHASRVLEALGVRHHFETIIDVREAGFNSKPHWSAYARALEILDARADECIMVEDTPGNLAPARALGMLTVLVSNQSSPESLSRDEADILITDILELGHAIRPWLGGQ